MTPESETTLFKRLEQLDQKQDTILICLTGKPLETPPVPGLVQISQEHGIALAAQEKKIESLDNWRTKVKLRFAALSGAVVVIGFAFNRAWEWLMALFASKHD